MPPSAQQQADWGTHAYDAFVYSYPTFARALLARGLRVDPSGFLDWHAADNGPIGASLAAIFRTIENELVRLGTDSSSLSLLTTLGQSGSGGRRRQDPPETFRGDAVNGAVKNQELYEDWKGGLQLCLASDPAHYDTSRKELLLAFGCMAGDVRRNHENAIRIIVKNDDDLLQAELPQWTDLEDLFATLDKEYIVTNPKINASMSFDKLEQYDPKTKVLIAWPNFLAQLNNFSARAGKTAEQKAESLLQKCEPRMQTMFATLTDPPAMSDFAGWAKHGNQFYENMQRLEHYQRSNTTQTLNPFVHNQPRSNNNPSRPNPPARDPDAMDLDAMRSAGAPERLNALTPEERAWCMANDACLRCRQRGHMKRDCPNVRNGGGRNNNGGNFNGQNNYGGNNNSNGRNQNYTQNYNGGFGGQYRPNNNGNNNFSSGNNYRSNSPGRRNASPGRGRRNSFENLRHMEA